jgi:hypothetical protein
VSALAAACEALARGVAGPDGSVAATDDGADFRRACQVHGVAPLLHLRLSGNGAAPAAPDGPAGLSAWLAHQYRQNRRRVARMLGELEEVLALFDRAGVPLMPMKGAVLLPLWYDDPGARPMNDLDLLLPAEHAEAADELLGRLGYRRTFEGWKHSRYARPGEDVVVDETSEHPDNPRRIELHPRCRERVRDQVIDLTDRMWASAERRPFLGTTAWLPSAEALWLHLVIHATHHVLLNTFRLMQLVDLHRLTPSVGDPAALLDGIDPRAAYPSLRLLQRYFPDERVAGLLAGLAERLPPAYVAWADGLDLVNASYLEPAPWRAT